MSTRGPESQDASTTIDLDSCYANSHKYKLVCQFLMSSQEVHGLKIKTRFEDLSAEGGYILPTVALRIAISSTATNAQGLKELIITNMVADVSIRERGQSSIMTIGTARPTQLIDKWRINADTTLTLYLTVDNYVLSQIEKIRGNDNLLLKIDLKFQAHQAGNPAGTDEFRLSIDHQTVAKSRWVEDVLPQLRYKNVALVEIPRLEYKDLNETIDKLNIAWKKYAMGDTDDVLVKCRTVLEDLSTYVRKLGFEKEDEKGEKKVPDWKKFLGSDSRGDIIEMIIRKVNGFTVRGAHTGGVIDHDDAYFALLQTFSLAYYVIAVLGKQVK